MLQTQNASLIRIFLAGEQAGLKFLREFADKFNRKTQIRLGIMADPILITQIINSLGLSGKDAEDKRFELEKLSNDELTKLLASSAEFKKTDIGSFRMLENEKTNPDFNSGGIFSQNVPQNQELEGFSHSSVKTASKMTYVERQQAREFVQNYLFDAAQNANKTFYDYGADYGILNRMWSGFKNIADTFDVSDNSTAITTVKEMKKSLTDEYNCAEKLKNIEKQGAFEFQFEKLRGKEFDAAKILDFKEKSEKYLEISIYKEKYDNLNRGIRELESIYNKEQAIRELKARGQIIPDSAQPAALFDEKFIQIIDDYCSGDENLKKQLISEISKDILTKSALSDKQNFIKALNILKSKTQRAYEEKLGGKSFETYQKDYQNAYKSALGGSNPEEITEQWVENQKMGAAGVKIGGIIVSTIALGGSNLMAAGTSKLAQAVGTKAATQITKLGMTLFGSAQGVAFDYANALTSHSGLTDEKNEEILGAAKDALPYAFFGAYVSGPLGNKIASALKSSGTASKLMEKAFNSTAKAADFTAEIGADTLFELAISDNDLMNVLKNNATGESQGRLMNKFGAMLLGGRANSAAKAAMRNAGLENAKIRQTPDNKFQLVLTDGKKYTADSPEALLGGIFAKVGENLQKMTEGYFSPIEDNGFSYKKSILGKKRQIKPLEGKPEQVKIKHNKIEPQKNPHPSNLTNELQKSHYTSAEIRELLANNPNLSRTVGKLPQFWGRKLAGKDGIASVDKCFSDFTKNRDISALEKNLSGILGEDVSVKLLGNGQFGAGYEIDVNGTKFVLKAFHAKHGFTNDGSAESLARHGNFAELASAVYASKHTGKNEFAKFYMGKFGENNDGYILTKFITPNEMAKPDEFKFSSFVSRMVTGDKKSDNVYGKTVIDYGASAPNKILDHFTAEEFKITKQLADALDAGDVKKMDDLIEKYGKSPAFGNSVKYFKMMINDNVLGCVYKDGKIVYNIDVFASKKDLLAKLGINYCPDVRSLAKYKYAEIGVLAPHYGMTKNQLYKLVWSLDAPESVEKMPKREDLKRKLLEGKKPLKNDENLHIHIPKGKFAANNSKFAETDEAFNNIIYKRQKDLLKLSRIVDSGEFTRKTFDLFVDEMGLGALGLKLEFVDDNFGGMALHNGQIRINLNKLDVNGNLVPADRATLTNRVAHELNHVLQNKEVIVECGADAYIAAIAKNKYNLLKSEYPDFTLQDFIEITKEGCEDFISNVQAANYPKSPVNSLNHQKAEHYRNAIKNYVDESVDEAAYIKNFNEIEAYRRGELVENTYRNLIKLNSSAARDLAVKTGLKYDDIYNNIENLETDGIEVIKTLFSPEIMRFDPDGAYILDYNFKNNEKSGMLMRTLINNLQNKSYDEIIASTPRRQGFALEVLKKLGFNIG